MYLISYDIASDRLRRKIATKLEDYGTRIQYSVFECDITEKRFRKLYGEICKMTEGLEDGSVRFYFLCANCQPRMRLIGQEKPSAFRTGKEDIIII